MEGSERSTRKETRVANELTAFTSARTQEEAREDHCGKMTSIPLPKERRE